MLKYADFLLHTAIGNASEFISCALEQNLDLIAKRENYVDYIANRPHVECVSEHGLYTDTGKSVVLSKVQEEVTHHKGAVWTHVISLRRSRMQWSARSHISNTASGKCMPPDMLRNTGEDVQGWNRNGKRYRCSWGT